MAALETSRGPVGTVLDANVLDRIKVCSATFSEIIADSGAYKSKLSEIKVIGYFLEVLIVSCLMLRKPLVLIGSICQWVYALCTFINVFKLVIKCNTFHYFCLGL